MLDNMDIGRILRRALAGGGEFADLYYEEGASTAVVCEDGKIEKVLAATERGVGLRVISDLRTAYAFTNEVTEASLLELAETVSRAVTGQVFEQAIDLRPKIVNNGYPVQLPPSGITLREKVEMVNLADRTARGVDARIRQVMVVYRDGMVKYQFANSLGEFIETGRTGTAYGRPGCGGARARLSRPVMSRSEGRSVLKFSGRGAPKRSP